MVGREKMDDFFQNLGQELNKELDSVLEEITDHEVRREEETRDFCDILKTVADYTECNANYVQFPQQDEKEKGAVFLVHLTPVDNFHLSLPVITAWGSSESSQRAKQAAAKRALFLFKQIRHVS